MCLGRDDGPKVFEPLFDTCQHAELLPCIELAFPVSPEFLFDLPETILEMILSSYEVREQLWTVVTVAVISYDAWFEWGI
jgi:hypothetical protein